jgi:ribosomal-protein-alanine N-acetyltransferase
MALPILTTSRLTLRPYTEDDIDALHAIWIDPDVRRYLWDDVVISRERAAEVVRDSIATALSHGIGYWTVRTAPDGPIIGDCGFRLCDGVNAIELLYSLARTHWGRGQAFEGSQAALRYAWTATPFDRVYAKIDAPNEASLRLIRRLGFQYLSRADGVDTYALAKPDVGQSGTLRRSGTPPSDRAVGVIDP